MENCAYDEVNVIVDKGAWSVAILKSASKPTRVGLRWNDEPDKGWFLMPEDMTYGFAEHLKVYGLGGEGVDADHARQMVDDTRQELEFEYYKKYREENNLKTGS